MYPGNDNFFKVDDISPWLDEYRSDIFHRFMARFLFASKRNRKDIQV